jgi:hypothetical protein
LPLVAALVLLYPRLNPRTAREVLCVRCRNQGRQPSHECHRPHHAMGASSPRCPEQVRDAPVAQQLDARERKRRTRARSIGRAARGPDRRPPRCARRSVRRIRRTPPRSGAPCAQDPRRGSRQEHGLMHAAEPGPEAQAPPSRRSAPPRSARRRRPAPPPPGRRGG